VCTQCVFFASAAVDCPSTLPPLLSPCQVGDVHLWGLGIGPVATCTVLASFLESDVQAFDVHGGDGPAALRLRRLAAGMVASLSAAFAAGLQPAALRSASGNPTELSAWSMCIMLPVLSAAALLGLAGARRDPVGAQAWRSVLLLLRPFEWLAACMDRLARGTGVGVPAVSLLHTAVAVVAALPDEARAAALASARAPAAGSPAPLEFSALASAVVVETGSQIVAWAEALETLWRDWQRGALTSPAEVVVVLERFAQQAGAQWPDLALPRPDEALAALRSCSNPLCGELGGDSEAGLPRCACGRCGAVSYCSTACQRRHWALGHKQQCAGPAAAAPAAAVAGLAAAIEVASGAAACIDLTED
jgi:hypothetical protein